MLAEAYCSKHHPTRAEELPSDGSETCRTPSEFCADWESDLLEESARKPASCPDDVFRPKPAENWLVNFASFELSTPRPGFNRKTPAHSQIVTCSLMRTM